MASYQDYNFPISESYPQIGPRLDTPPHTADDEPFFEEIDNSPPIESIEQNHCFFPIDRPTTPLNSYNFESKWMIDDLEAQALAFIEVKSPPKDPDAGEKTYMYDDRDLLADYDIRPLYGNVYSIDSDYAGDNGYEKIVLFRGPTGQMHFIHADEFGYPTEPFDTLKFYKYFRVKDRKGLNCMNEFIYNGKNIFADTPLDPWFTDRETGEIKSYFQMKYGKLLYKTGGQNHYRELKEDFETAYKYEWMYTYDYGVKIKQNGVWRLDLHNPKSTIYHTKLHSYPFDFRKMTVFPKQYETAPEKYDNTIGTMRWVIMKTLIDDYGHKLSDIYLPFKMIGCVFKTNSERITKRIENPAAFEKIKYTKTGRISRAKTKTPCTLVPAKDVFNLVATFEKLINGGIRPEIDFYNCANCASESVCLYREHMEKHHAEMADQALFEKQREYAAKHRGQMSLFLPGISK